MNISSTFLARTFLFLLLIAGAGSCVKDTYDLDTLSRQGEINPKVALKIAKGRLNLGNAIEADDSTIRFNNDQTISILLREDSLLSFGVDDLIEIPTSLPESGPEVKTFTAGDLALDDFSSSRPVSLQEISSNLPAPYGTAISSLDGQNAPFPAVSPPQTAGSYTFSAFGNYSMVTFSSGILSLTLTNNLPVVLEPVTVKLLDANNTEIGTVTYNNVPANGGSQTRQIDLSGLTLINNQFTAEITALGTRGSATPVLISLSDEVVFGIQTQNATISSGTAILPDQVFAQDASNIDLALTGGEEVHKIILKHASIDYTVTSNIQEDLRVHIILPSATTNGSPAEYTEIVSYNGGNPSTGSISLDNLEADLTTDPVQPYNIIPFEYEIEIVSSDNLVTFDFSNDLQLEFTVSGIEYSYLEGYLGKMVESFDQDTLTVEDEIFDRISGTFELADPKVQFFYTNSFGVPIELALNATGYFDGGSTVDLGAVPQLINHPSDTNDLYITDTLKFDKNNTELENLLVLPPPREVVYSGSATTNPAEDKNILNFVTNNSRIDVGLEAEIPLDFSASNLSLADTLEIDVGDDFDWDDIAYSKIYIGIDTNWFPLDISFEITPYNSQTDTRGTPLVVNMLVAATVNAEGIVETPTRHTETVDLESAFFQELSTSDNLIVKVSLGTSGGGAQPVKLLTTYSLSFNIGLLTEFNYPFTIE